MAAKIPRAAESSRFSDDSPLPAYFETLAPLAVRAILLLTLSAGSAYAGLLTFEAADLPLYAFGTMVPLELFAAAMLSGACLAISRIGRSLSGKSDILYHRIYQVYRLAAVISGSLVAIMTMVGIVSVSAPKIKGHWGVAAILFGCYLVGSLLQRLLSRYRYGTEGYDKLFNRKIF